MPGGQAAPPAVTPVDTSLGVDAVKKAAQQGFQLSASLNVRDNAAVDAVLIPPRLAAKVFGNTVGNDYAVIALTISNRSPEAALIVHTIFIDYSRWLLSGGSPTIDNDKCAVEQNNPAEKKLAIGNRLQPWQTQTCPNQIASVEYRIVRDQLQHDQPYTGRNWVIRSLELAGSIATASTFSIGGRRNPSHQCFYGRGSSRHAYILAGRYCRSAE